MDCIMKGQYVLYNFNVTKIKKKKHNENLLCNMSDI